MENNQLENLKMELSVKCKNGVEFTLAASIIWLIISYIWTLEFKPYEKSVLVFISAAPLVPIAFLFSKILKTSWKIAGNPLQPLGLWLNFAQLFYFPFLIFAMIKIPAYFIMVYAIITGAHLFPYAWFYKTNLYAIFAGIIALGVLLLGLFLSDDKMYWIAIFTGSLLCILTVFLYFDASKKLKKGTIHS